MTGPVAAPLAPPEKKTSVLAIAAFVLSLILCLPPLSILGAILGIVALVRMGGHPELGGKTLAIVSIPLGALSIVVTGILASIAIPSFVATASRAKMSEATANLMAVQTAETSYQLEHSAFSPDLATIGFQPEHGNRYAYFLAPSGPSERRGATASPPPAHPVIIDVDTAGHPGRHAFATFADTGCPLTVSRADGGPPLTLGVSGAGDQAAFLAAAAGNVDNDATVDCWSISSVTRRTTKGATIAAGKPFHEQDDVHH